MKKVLSLVLVLFTVVLLLASCGEKTADQQTVDDATEMLVLYNKPTEADKVKAANFTLPSKLEYEGYTMDVAWTVEGGDGLVTVVEGDEKDTIKVNKYADKDTEFTLKATVSSGKVKNTTTSFTYVIKQYVIASWDYWKENVTGVNMNIKGVIVAKYPYNAENKNTGLFLQDLDGQHGYFAYRIKCDSQSAYDTDLAIGNVIEVNGTTSLYNGFREMGAGCTYDVVKDDAGKIVTAEVKKVAIDDFVTDMTKLDELQGMVATLTGFKVKSIDWNTNTADTFESKGAGSVYVTLTKGGKDFKLYLSTSNQLTLADLVSEYGKLGIGYTVDVEGPIAWYNAGQLYPCAGGITVTSTEVTPEDKIAAELLTVTIPANVTEPTPVALPGKGNTYSDVEYTWNIEGAEDSYEVDGRTITFLPTEGVKEVTLTLTATCGTATETKEFKVSVVAGDPSYADIVKSAYNLEAGASLDGTYRLYGEIVSIDTEYSEQYGNITVTIKVEGVEDKPIQCFRMKGEGCADLKVGDKITVEGVIKNYKGTIEFDSGCALIGLGEIIDPAKIVKAAYRLENGETMENITLTGVIKSVDTAYSEQYGNITVTIVIGDLEDKPIQCFRAKGAEGIDISGLAVNDTITVTGVIKNYKGTIEFDSGCLVSEIVKAAE